MTSDTPLVSVIINNYNYSNFIAAAIESVLDQTYPLIETIVVDDGSTDGSRDIIQSYSNRVIPVLKDNGGQASAINAGFSRSSGAIIFFLDSDDIFFHEKVACIVNFIISQDLLEQPVLIHHLLNVIDVKGNILNVSLEGRVHKSPFNGYAFAKRHRYVPYEAGPTSSICITRTLAHILLPLPEDGVRISADDFLVFGATLAGALYSFPECVGSYRTHGSNNWYGVERLKSEKFVNQLEIYLNTILICQNLAPVVNFQRSMHICPDLIKKRKWIRLFIHLPIMILLDRSYLTLNYSYHTLVVSGMTIKRDIIGWLRKIWYRSVMNGPTSE